MRRQASTSAPWPERTNYEFRDSPGKPASDNTTSICKESIIGFGPELSKGVVR